jgi:cell division protein FtsL
MLASMGRFLGLLLLVAAVLASAVAAIWARHEARSLFAEIEALNGQRDELNIDWGRLQIERSTWATHGRVEKLARQQLDMRIPDPGGVEILKP